MQENWYDWAVRTKDYLQCNASPRQFDAEKRTMSTARFVGQNSASVPRICISAL